VNSKFANLMSYVFHPLMMATYLFSAIIFIEPMQLVPPGYTIVAQWLIILVVWLTTFAIPAISLVLLKFTGNITSLKLHNRKERLIPFFYATVFYFFTAYYFTQQMLLTDLASGVFIVIAIMILLAAIITFLWKISVHSLGMGGVVGLLLIITTTIPESSIYLISLVAILLSGLVLSARLKLQAHTTLQVYTGFALGFVVSFMIIFWI
jgi:hypothetical protein